MRPDCIPVRPSDRRPFLKSEQAGTAEAVPACTFRAKRLYLGADRSTAIRFHEAKGEDQVGRITLILGGAKSGKTSQALEVCRRYPAPRIYLATAEARDEEMSVRIIRHQAERGPEWRTVEEPLDPARVLREPPAGGAGVVLMDCLTLWLSNLMAGKGLSTDQAVERCRELAEAARVASCPVVIVSNEVGQGIVPDNRLARDFRDAAGVSHQVLARAADEVLFVVAGLAQILK